jgi:hypothetical protein
MFFEIYFENPGLLPKYLNGELVKKKYSCLPPGSARVFLTFIFICSTFVLEEVFFKVSTGVG